MRLTFILFIAFLLQAEDISTPSELQAAHARIAWLEQKLAATEKKCQAYLDVYTSEMQLNALQKQEPSRPKQSQGDK